MKVPEPRVLASVPFWCGGFWNNGIAGRLPHRMHEAETESRMNLEKTGTLILLAATLLVALSILLDGTASRLFNGLGGITWFTAAGLLGIAAWRSSKRLSLWLLAMGLTALVAFVVTPSDFVPAMIGFGLAGTTMALFARPPAVLWAKLVVGLYLPFHIGTAVAKAIYRSATGSQAALRTDPPPTAALVPLVMLITAVVCASVVSNYLDRRVPTEVERGRTLSNT